MSIKLLGPFSILGVAGLLIAACGDKPEVDAGASLGEPAVLSSWEGWPLTADGAIRRELAELEAQRASSADWPLTADGAIRRELAELEAQRASSADWPLTADGTIRRELAELEAQRAGD